MADQNHLIALERLVTANLPEELSNWLSDKIESIVSERGTRDLFMTYSILGTKASSDGSLQYLDNGKETDRYLAKHKANQLELARLYLLSKVLEADKDFFVPKVANIIQVADKSELAMFLRYLILLPNPGAYVSTAADALRTNIASVFNALAANNPYPAKYFSDAQWNQMFLKAAFMQQDLTAIERIDERANKDLARIISDYAHERWSAGREVDPFFWRPVAPFIEGDLVNDMKKLLESDNPVEQKAGALAVYNSPNPEAKRLLDIQPKLKEQLENNELTWNTIK